MRRRILLAAAGLLMLAAPEASADPAAERHPVRVVSVRPEREKLASLRFLKENIDFVRSRLDRLREEPRRAGSGADPLDPRLVFYQELSGEIEAALAELASAEAALDLRDVLDGIDALARVEEQLGLLEERLEEQERRLARVQEDFAGRQETALVVLIQGSPAPIRSLAAASEDMEPEPSPLSEARRESLERGGVVQIFHELVEPREQWLTLEIGVEGGPDATAFIGVEPLRDRLTFLLIELDGFDPAREGLGIRAWAWEQRRFGGGLLGAAKTP